MRVLHLSTSDLRGGAARGAYFLHRRLREQGVDSRMLVGRKYGEDSHVTQLRGALAPLTERVRGKLDRWPLRSYGKTDESFWTLGWQNRDLRGAVAKLAPDLVHLQWTGGGFLPVEALRQSPAPLVWTLRDMWAFTGGCHYTAGCDRYVSGCGACPQLRSAQADDISSATVTRKHRAWQGLDITVVPISAWMAARARASQLLRATPATVIPNGIDTSVFRPAEKRQARMDMGLPEEGRYILFSALNALQDTRKGFWHLAEALERFAGGGAPAPKLLIAGGMPEGEAPELPVETHFVGRVDDDDRLAALYAAADVVAAPSLQEAFGKVHAEAMACGTPVVAFDSGGPSEIVVHRETGYLAEAFDVDDLARGLSWCLERTAVSPALGEAARERAERLYDIGVVARDYIDLYDEILEGSHGRSAA